MFADYREAIDRAQRHDDEILFLRGANQELQTQLAQERADNLTRERALNDKLMDMRFGRRTPTTEATASPSSPTLEHAESSGDMRAWQKGKWSQLEHDVREYYKKQQVSGQPGPVTN